MFLGKSKFAKLNREHNTKKNLLIHMINSFTFLPAPLFNSPCLSFSLISPFFFLLSSIKSKNQCKLQRKEQFKLNYFAIVKSLKVSQFF